MKTRYIAITILCLGVWGISHAQNNPTEIKEKEMKEVVVKGRNKTVKERAEFKRHGQTTEVMSKEEINRNNPMFIEQSLGTLAGVQVDKRTQLGGQRIVIRGYGNDQKFNNWGVKCYYNGIPLTTADGVTVLDDVDFGVVNNIEVIKGPASTMYGSGVGGVARFYLKNDEPKGVTLEQKLIGGSFNLMQSHSRVTIAGEQSNFSINYGFLGSDGYRPHGDSRKNFFTAYGDLRLNEKDRMTVFASHNKSLEKISGQVSYADYYAGRDPGNAAYIKKDARNDFTTDRFGLSNFYTFNQHLSNQTAIFYSNSDYTNVSAGAYGNSMNPNYGIRSVFSLKNKFGAKFDNDLNLGMELQQSKSLVSSYRFTGTNDTFPTQVQDISKGSYFRNTNNQTSFFLHNHLTYTPWDVTLVLGLSSNKIRYARTDLLAPTGLLSTYGKDLSFSRSFDASLNPHLALQKTWKKQIINVSYSRGYNAPTSATAFIGTINKTNDSLLPERAGMFDVSVQGLLFNTQFDYQVSWFTMRVTDKLTQLNGKDPQTGTAYAYWANTGVQQNSGFEASLGYAWLPKKSRGFLKKVEPFASLAQYQFEYKDFSNRSGSNVVDYSGKQVVGVPQTKFTVGLDITSRPGFYLNTTLNSMGDVYTDFANTNKVKGFTLLNAKVGYKHRFMKDRFSLDVYAAGNNLTSQINYTFLFLGNSINDSDPGSGYPAGVATDVNPGYNKAWFFGGVNLSYHLN